MHVGIMPPTPRPELMPADKYTQLYSSQHVTLPAPLCCCFVATGPRANPSRGGSHTTGTPKQHYYMIIISLLYYISLILYIKLLYSCIYILPYLAAFAAAAAALLTGPHAHLLPGNGKHAHGLPTPRPEVTPIHTCVDWHAAVAAAATAVPQDHIPICSQAMESMHYDLPPSPRPELLPADKYAKLYGLPPPPPTARTSAGSSSSGAAVAGSTAPGFAAGSSSRQQQQQRQREEEEDEAEEERHKWEQRMAVMPALYASYFGEMPGPGFTVQRLGPADGSGSSNPQQQQQQLEGRGKNPSSAQQQQQQQRDGASQPGREAAIESMFASLLATMPGADVLQQHVGEQQLLANRGKNHNRNVKRKQKLKQQKATAAAAAAAAAEPAAAGMPPSINVQDEGSHQQQQQQQQQQHAA